MEENKKKPISGKIFAFFAIVLLIVYLVVQLSNFLARDVKTATLREYSLEDKTLSCMLIYKDEAVINSDISGGCDYFVSNGQKVSAGEKVAVIYKNLDSPELLNNIRNLELQIESYNDMIESESTFDYDITKLDASIDDSIYAILGFVESGDIPGSGKDLTELKRLLHKRGLIDGNETDIAANAAQLKSQLDGIISQNTGSMSNIYSKTSGFFSSEYDGLEGMAPLSVSEGITVERFNSLIDRQSASTAPSGYVGTVTTGFNWNGSFKVSSDYIINKGDYIKIRLSDYSDETFYVDVVDVSASKGGEKVVTVSSKSHIDLLTKSRFQSIEIIDKVYRGYRVTRDAIKTVDSKTGVFVIKGKILSFQPVEILYSGEDFVIITNADEGMIYANDDVVISGKNLYDGKVISTNLR